MSSSSQFRNVINHQKEVLIGFGYGNLPMRFNDAEMKSTYWKINYFLKLIIVPTNQTLK